MASIAYERVGTGPAVILVGGGAVDRSENAPLAPELAEHFTVYNYDRRGRGDSGDTLPYGVERGKRPGATAVPGRYSAPIGASS